MAVFEIRIRPIGSNDVGTRLAKKYEWEFEGDAVLAYSMPKNIPVEDVTITDLNLAEATDLLDRLHEARERLHRIPFEKEVI